MGRMGIFDRGYESFGFPGGGLPNERYDLGAVAGDSSVQASTSSFIPKGANVAAFTPLKYGKDDPRLGTLVGRLQTVGCRQDPRVPPVFDDQLSSDVLAFQQYAGIPYTPDGEVDATTWYKLNQDAYLVGRGEKKPYGVRPGPAQTMVAKGAKQPTDNTLNAKASASAQVGNKLLVKTPAGKGDSTDTGSVKDHNDQVKKELERKTKRDVSSLAGEAKSPYRPEDKTAPPATSKGLMAGIGGLGLVAVILIFILIFKPDALGL